MLKTMPVALVCIALSAPAPRSAMTEPAPINRITATLDAMHDAASRADFDRYFSTFAIDGVFIGTDAGERWTIDEFKAFCKPYFDKGQGWTYMPRKPSRHISLSADGTIAWFDELLDNTKYGVCRGTGVLRRARHSAGLPSDWQILQYSLSIPIPNAKAAEVVALIRRGDAAASQPSP